VLSGLAVGSGVVGGIVVDLEKLGLRDKAGLLPGRRLESTTQNP
jgi:hypothetical protein